MPNSLDIDSQFHVTRGMLKSQEAQEKYQQKTKERRQSARQQLVITAAQPTVIDKLEESAKILSKGLMAGGMAGMVIGTIYGVSIRYANPLQLGIQTAVNIGLISGQFMGFKYLLPTGLSRVSKRLDSALSQNTFDHEGQPEQKMSYFKSYNSGQGDTGVWIGGSGFGDMPEFLSDMTKRDWDIVGSTVAGTVAGYLTNRIRGSSIAKQQQLSTRHAHNIGFRGGIVWGLIFGVGHYISYKMDDWRVQRVAQTSLRHLYDTNQTQKLKDVVSELPDKHDVLPVTVNELRKDPSLFWEKVMDVKKMPDYFWALNPYVISEENYNLINSLEKQEKELVEEIIQLEKIKASQSEQN